MVKILRLQLIRTLSYLVCLINLTSTDVLANNAGFDILIIHSDPQSFPAVTLFNNGVKEYFRTNDLDVDIHFENLSSSIAGGDTTYNKLFTELLEIKYLKDMPDAIVCVERDVVEWLLDYAPPPCKAIPVFYIGGIFDMRHVPEHFYKIELEYDVNDCMSAIMKVLPDTEHIYYIIDDYSKRRLEREIDFSNYDLDIEFVSGIPVSDIVDKINTAPDKTVVYYQSVYNSGRKDVVPYDVLEKINHHTTIPIFVTGTHFINDLNNNVVGGHCYVIDSVGYNTAACIDSVLTNLSQTQKHFKIDCSSHYFSDKALDKFNIPSNRLPQGSAIVNKEKTIWDFWIPISVFLGLVVLEAFSIFVLLWQRRKMRIAKSHIDSINLNLENKINEQVSEIREQNDLLQEKHKRITALQKHKELISNMIIHDLKNPLSVILNYQNIANRKLREELVQGAGKNMLNLISNIMDVYKIENHSNKL
ncbi:MAG: hypothetical protein MI866_16315, partial [Bacteroidales bacterium]|nr:hypothetical protein [Bacteroidales bacterium]